MAAQPRYFPVKLKNVPQAPMTQKEDCEEKIRFYYNKYIEQYGPYICQGPFEYPKNYEELSEMLNTISDKWDLQIACVLTGNKKVAMIDYDQYDEQMKADREWYYKKNPMDTDLRKVALECGVQRMYEPSGTEYYYWPEYRRNAEILININLKTEKVPEEISGFVYSLLLGYSDISIICYDIFQQILQDAFRVFPDINIDEPSEDQLEYLNFLYEEFLDEERLSSYSKMLNNAKRWILQQGGRID